MRIENELKEISTRLSMEELERLCEDAGIALFHIDNKTGDIWLNRHTTKLTGYMPGEIEHSYNTKMLLTYDEDYPLIEEQMKALQRGEKESYQLEYRMRRKDGTLVWVHENLFVAEKDKEGNILRLAGIATDLSRIKWVEEQLIGAKIENKALLKNSTQGELQEQIRMLRASNQAASMIIGGFHQDYSDVLWQAIEIMGNGILADQVHLWKNEIDDTKELLRHFTRWDKGSPTLNNSENYELLYTNFFPDWKEYLNKDICVFSRAITKTFKENTDIRNDMSVIMIPLFLHGKYWGCMEFDVKDGRREFTDSEITIMGSGAKSIIASISRNETLSQLNKARISAVESMNAKTNFLSRMSHEIRTPMNAIIGMTTIAKDANDFDRVRYCIDRIDESAKQLLGLINDILDMSKIEANKLELNNKQYNFERMIHRVLSITQVRAEEKHIRLDLDMDEAFTKNIYGDELRLSQVLINLLSNAVKFTPEYGQVTMSIRLKDSTCERTGIRIDVKDTGIGIKPQYIERLFDAFEQVDSNNTRRFGGTGLGLAITKNIVNLMGGNIWVESEEDIGSNFIIEYEAQWGDALEISEQFASVPSSLHILLIDDNPKTKRYFANILNNFSIGFDLADDVSIALELLEAKERIGGKYDVIFVDYEMPSIKEDNMIDKIREINSQSEIVVVVESNQESDDIIKNTKANTILSKPILPSELFDTIMQLTKRNIVSGNEPKKKVAPDWSNKKILLAEDIKINQEIVRALLADSNAMVVCANNGQEAVDYFLNSKEEIDLILMDIQMPELDGLEATMCIRSSGKDDAKKIPIIAMTANAFKEDIDASLKSGMNAHLSKPVNVVEMMDVLSQYLDK